MERKKYIRVGEAAGMIGCSTQTLRSWGAQGILVPELIRDSGHRYYSVKQIEDFITSRRESSNVWGNYPLEDIESIIKGGE